MTTEKNKSRTPTRTTVILSTLLLTAAPLLTGVTGVGAKPVTNPATSASAARQSNNTNSNPALQTSQSVKLSLKKAERILAQRPLAPQERNRFYPGLAYPEVPQAPHLGGEDLPQKKASKMLMAYMGEESPGDLQTAVAVFNNPVAKEKIQSPKLRAALAALTPTVGAPAIDLILNAKTLEGLPKVKSIEFAEFPAHIPSDTGAFVEVDPATNQMTIKFNMANRGENPFRFAPTIAHEALHQDSVVATYEEATAVAVETLVMMEQLANHPELANPITAMSQVQNTKLVARLNSGTGSLLGLFATNGGQLIFPNSTAAVQARSFMDFFINPILANTPGNDLLRAYLKELSGVENTDELPGLDFNQQLLEWLDQHQGDISAKTLVKAAQALQLDASIH